VNELQTFILAWFRTKKLSLFQLDLHRFNPPPKASSYNRENEVLNKVGKILLACFQTEEEYACLSLMAMSLMVKINTISSAAKMAWKWPDQQ
jgi:hypothetical protein